MSALDQAMRAFGLTGPSRLVAQRENLTYRVGDWALRCHRQGYNSPAEIESELAWLVAISGVGVAVPRPKAAAEGYVVETSGTLWSCLSWEPGNALSNCLSETNFERLGGVLADVHLASDNWTPPNGFNRRNWNAEGLLGEQPVWGRFWENPFLEAAEFEMLVGFRDTALAVLREAFLDEGLIHADANGENVLVAKTGLTLIDFDDAGWGYRLFDLATPAQWHRYGTEADRFTDALIAGYAKRRDIDLTHFHLIRLIRAATYLGWIVPRIDEPGGQTRLNAYRAETLPRIKAWLGGL